jgi:hypothetical protein
VAEGLDHLLGRVVEWARMKGWGGEVVGLMVDGVDPGDRAVVVAIGVEEAEEGIVAVGSHKTCDMRYYQYGCSAVFGPHRLYLARRLVSKGIREYMVE